MMASPNPIDRDAAIRDGWHVASGVEAIDRAAALTRTVLPTGSAPPTSEPLWAACYWRAFCGSLGEPESHLLMRGGRARAFLATGRRRGVMPRVSNCANDHVPIFAVAAYDDGAGGIHDTVRHLLESTAVLVLEPVYRDGDFAHAVLSASAEQGATTALVAKYPEIAAHLTGPWEEARRRLSPSAVSVASRRARQLDRMGRLELDCVANGSGLDDLLTECFSLEAEGWKGQSGSPIASEPDTLRFYTALAKAYAAAGRLALYTLRLDGRLIAFQYCLRTGSRLDLLKMSYAEDLSRVSPGNVIRLLGYQYELETYGALNFFMGRVREWKQIWGTTSYERCGLMVYADDFRGRLAYASGPALRRNMKAVLQRTGLWRRPAGHAG